MVRVSLPEILDFGGASKVAGQLLELRGQDVQIDAAGVRKLTGIGLEVLFAAQKQWRADDKVLSITAWPDDTLQTLDALAADPATLSGVS